MKELSILFTSVGRRSQLIDCFRKAGSELGITAHIYGADLCPTLAPAAHLVDRCFQVPRCTEEAEYVDALIQICEKHAISIIVPTIDTELLVMSKQQSAFLERDIRIIISGPKTVHIACDKTETHWWLVRNGFPTVEQADIKTVLKNPEPWTFPLIAKPRGGSASVGVRVVGSLCMLRALSEEDPSLIVQQLAHGSEHTINIFVTKDSKCVCAIPHIRLETRGGEVSKGRTVRHQGMIELALRIGDTLPDAYGPLNIQCFLDSDGTIKIIEINARFGGGYPLADRAGAKFARWILEEHLGLQSTARNNCWQNGLTMLRYDEAVFLDPQ